MNASLIGALVDSAIPLLGGLFATAYGLGWIGQADEKTARHRAILKVLGPLLVLYGGTLVAYSLAKDHTGGAEGRAMFVQAANTQAGAAVDEETVLVSVTDTGTHIQFDYKLHRLAKDQIDAAGLQQALTTTMTASLCGNDVHRQALAAWGPFKMRYVDAMDSEITTLAMVEADCQ